MNSTFPFYSAARALLASFKWIFHGTTLLGPSAAFVRRFIRFTETISLCFSRLSVFTHIKMLCMVYSRPLVDMSRLKPDFTERSHCSCLMIFVHCSKHAQVFACDIVKYWLELSVFCFFFAASSQFHFSSITI